MTHRAVELTCATLVIAACSGCLISVSGVSQTEGEVPRSVTDRVVCGETTRAWVIERLGEPDRCSPCADGSEVLTYEYTKIEKAKFSMLFLVGFSARNEKVHAIDFEVRDGIVHKVRRKMA